MMDMEPDIISVRTETIKLAQFLKFAGIAATGGEATHLVRQGEVRVNGRLETRRGRSLVEGDVVSVGDADFVLEVEEPVDDPTPDPDGLP